MAGAQRKSMSATPMPATILLIFSSRTGMSQCTLSVPRRFNGVSKSNLPGAAAAAGVPGGDFRRQRRQRQYAGAGQKRSAVRSGAEILFHESLPFLVAARCDGCLALSIVPSSHPITLRPARRCTKARAKLDKSAVRRVTARSSGSRRWSLRCRRRPAGRPASRASTANVRGHDRRRRCRGAPSRNFWRSCIRWPRPGPKSRAASGWSRFRPAAWTPPDRAAAYASPRWAQAGLAVEGRRRVRWQAAVAAEEAAAERPRQGAAVLEWPRRPAAALAAGRWDSALAALKWLRQGAAALAAGRWDSARVAAAAVLARRRWLAAARRRLTRRGGGSWRGNCWRRRGDRSWRGWRQFRPGDGLGWRRSLLRAGFGDSGGRRLRLDGGPGKGGNRHRRRARGPAAKKLREGRNQRRTEIGEKQAAFDERNHHEDRKPCPRAKGRPREAVGLAHAGQAHLAVGDAFLVSVEDAARVLLQRQLLFRIQLEAGAFVQLFGKRGIAIARLAQLPHLLGRRRLYSTVDHGPPRPVGAMITHIFTLEIQDAGMPPAAVPGRTRHTICCSPMLQPRRQARAARRPSISCQTRSTGTATTISRARRSSDSASPISGVSPNTGASAA